MPGQFGTGRFEGIWTVRVDSEAIAAIRRKRERRFMRHTVGQLARAVHP